MNSSVSSREKNSENFIFCLAFLLALTLRLVHLNTNPLTDIEAKWALQALAIARGDHPILGGQPGYIILTAISFFIFNGSNFVARFWPAMIGSGLVLVPFAFRKDLGLKAAVILSFALALDPGLLAISRMAGSPILAVSFTAMCLATWRCKKVKIAGFLGGMALLSGPSIWFGVMGFGISWIILRYVINSKVVNEETESNEGLSDFARNSLAEVEVLETNQHSNGDSNPLKVALIWGILTIIFAGTLFFLVPAGLSAWAGSLVDFFRGWTTIFLLKPGFLLLAVLIYSTLALFFLINRLFRSGFKQRNISLKSLVLCVTFLLLVLTYPAHQVGDLAWMLVPLWIIAALEMSDQLVLVDDQKLEIIVTSVITFIFMAFIWLNLVSFPVLTNSPLPVQSPILLSIQKFFQSIGFLVNGTSLSRILIWVGSLLIYMMSMLLVSAIWDKRVAKLGSLWGITFALFLYTINSSIAAAGLRIPPTAEFWQPAPRLTQAYMLENTMNDISAWKIGHKRDLDVSILSTINYSGVNWLLRDWNLTHVDALSAANSPSLIILPESYDLKLASPYRKLNFVYMKTPIWDGLSLNDWLKWITNRVIPEQNSNLVLWAREDLFSDATIQTIPSIP